MNCLKAEEQFSAYIEDELEYPAVKAFETHFATCEQCQREFALLRESLDLLHQLPQIEPSREFDSNLRIRLADTQIESAPFWYRVLNTLRPRPAWAFGGIAAVLVIFAGIYLYQNTFVKSSSLEIATRLNTPSAHRYPEPIVKIRSNELRRTELPLAVPDLRPQSLVKFPEFPEFDPQALRERQFPQRIEQNYIL